MHLFYRKDKFMELTSIKTIKELKNMFGFQQYIGLANGTPANICCSADKGFREHFFGQFATLASHRPKLIMVDGRRSKS